jgi:hypothetical protein
MNSSLSSGERGSDHIEKCKQANRITAVRWVPMEENGFSRPLSDNEAPKAAQQKDLDYFTVISPD